MSKDFAVICMFALATMAGTIGCDQSEPTATKADTAEQRAKQNADALADSAKQAGDSASKEVKDAAADAAKRAEDVAKDSSRAVRVQAESLLDKANQAVREMKWADAEALADQLDKLIPQLPPEWADRVKQLRAAINAGKNK